MGFFPLKSAEILILTYFLLISNSNARIRIKESANVLEKPKKVDESRIKNWNDSFSEFGHASDESGFELSREKEESRFHKRNIDSNEIQIVYWYYDKITAAILGIFFGVALEMENAKTILQQPIGPSIAIFCKFMLSPFVS